MEGQRIVLSMFFLAAMCLCFKPTPCQSTEGNVRQKQWETIWRHIKEDNESLHGTKQDTADTPRDAMKSSSSDDHDKWMTLLRKVYESRMTSSENTTPATTTTTTTATATTVPSVSKNNQQIDIPSLVAFIKMNKIKLTNEQWQFLFNEYTMKQAKNRFGKEILAPTATTTESPPTPVQTTTFGTVKTKVVEGSEEWIGELQNMLNGPYTSQVKPTSTATQTQQQKQQLHQNVDSVSDERWEKLFDLLLNGGRVASTTTQKIMDDEELTVALQQMLDGKPSTGQKTKSPSPSTTTQKIMGDEELVMALQQMLDGKPSTGQKTKPPSPSTTQKIMNDEELTVALQQMLDGKLSTGQRTPLPLPPSAVTNPSANTPSDTDADHWVRQLDSMLNGDGPVLPDGNSGRSLMEQHTEGVLTNTPTVSSGRINHDSSVSNSAPTNPDNRESNDDMWEPLLKMVTESALSSQSEPSLKEMKKSQQMFENPPTTTKTAGLEDELHAALQDMMSHGAPGFETVFVKDKGQTIVTPDTTTRADSRDGVTAGDINQIKKVHVRERAQQHDEMTADEKWEKVMELVEESVSDKNDDNGNTRNNDDGKSSSISNISQGTNKETTSTTTTTTTSSTTPTSASSEASRPLKTHHGLLIVEEVDSGSSKLDNRNFYILLAVGTSACVVSLILVTVAVLVLCRQKSALCWRNKDKQESILNSGGIRWAPQMFRPSKENVNAFLHGAPLSLAEVNVDLPTLDLSKY